MAKSRTAVLDEARAAARRRAIQRRQCAVAIDHLAAACVGARRGRSRPRCLCAGACDHWLRAYAHASAGDLGGAVAVLERARASGLWGGDARVYASDIADLLFAAGKLEEALAAHEEALAAWRADAWPFTREAQLDGLINGHRRRGDTLARLGRREESEEARRTARELERRWR